MDGERIAAGEKRSGNRPSTRLGAGQDARPVIGLTLLALLFALALPGPGPGASPKLETRNPTWSPDGTTLAYVRREPSGSSEIFAVRFDGRDQRRVTGPAIGIYGLTWSPGGRSIAYSANGSIWRVDVASGTARRLTSFSEPVASQPAWSPDGKTIAFTLWACRGCTRVYAIDSDGGEARLLVNDGRRPAWSRDGSLLLTSPPVALLDLATSQARLVADGAGLWASWSHDGTEFAYTGNGGVYVTSVTRLMPQLVVPSPRFVEYPTISPGHEYLAFVAGRRASIFRRDTERRVVLPRSDSGNDAPSWSVRGRLAFVANGPCGRRSEIDVVRSDGSRQHALVRACKAP